MEFAKQEVATSSLALIPGRTEGLVKEATSSPAKKKVCGCVKMVGGDVCVLQGRWICEMPSSEIKERVNLNKHITDKLEVRAPCLV